ncbi:helix-turn-helix domain-containing protein [Perlucidibaca aquatica]|uniref:helix-turn-helix domain-containing protein n=1 Tax=Perlucidibaca aquatica TaxID=1852776 RepID=UPI000839FE1C|nr:helix-turn-helix transcriptional regulator [Perlucidibaca aquatica]
MIRCHLSRLMGERRMNIADVMRETGIKRTMLTLMYNDEVQRLDVEALDKLCRLFSCNVQDILEFDSSSPHIKPL